MTTHLIATATRTYAVSTAYRFGLFAVHNQAAEDPTFKCFDAGVERRMRRWVVTHIPSGLKIGWNLTHEQACSLADHLGNTLGEEWLIDAPIKQGVSEEAKAEARAAVQGWMSTVAPRR